MKIFAAHPAEKPSPKNIQSLFVRPFLFTVVSYAGIGR